MFWIETLGLVASLIVAISMTMKNIKILRYLSLFGSLLFAAYGAILMLWPVLLLNIFVVAVNVYFLWSIAHAKTWFQISTRRDLDSPQVQSFLHFYADDLRKSHPDFHLDRDHKDYKAYFILRETLPVSLFIYYENERGELEIALDYVVPAYRDFKNARFLFHQGAFFMDLGGRYTFVTHSHATAHQRYLKRIGFAPDPHADAPHRFVFHLTFPVEGHSSSGLPCPC